MAREILDTGAVATAALSRWRGAVGYGLSSLLFLVLLSFALVSSAAAGGVENESAYLAIQVRTDAIPGVHFDAIRSEGVRIGPGPALATRTHVAHSGRDYGAGVRVAEWAVPLSIPGQDLGRDFVGSTAITLGGGVTTQRPWRITLESGAVHVVTILLPFQFEPVKGVSKAVTLEIDNDGNGDISPCDVVRHTIRFTATHDVGRGILNDDPRPSSTLIPGTVQTTHGRVFRGNVLSHSTVFVRYGFVPTGDEVVVTFLAKVPPVSNQGELTLELAGTTARYDLVTDDASTADVDDPTVVPRCLPDQFPIPGDIQIPPPKGAQQIITGFNGSISGYIGNTAFSAQQLIDGALADALQDPKEADRIGAELGLALGYLEEDVSKEIDLQRDLALLRAEAAGADKHQLDRIKKSAQFGRKMVKEMMKRLDDRFGETLGK